MKRLILEKLVKWKNSKHRKPLVLKGARQVGKTYILNIFGKEEFSQTHYFNFEESPKLSQVFIPDLDPKRIISELALIKGREIKVGSDLVIFDEVQDCPQALTSLKYFCEKLPELHLVCASSHMGILFLENSFPVGKVEELQLYPMNYEEFLLNCHPKSWEVFQKSKETLSLSPFEHEILWNHLREFYIVGGMPEAVKLFLENRDYQLCRKYQLNLVGQYLNDFHKHSGKTNALHIMEVFKNIPKQLSMSRDLTTLKYIFKDVIKGKNSYNGLAGPIEWLSSSSLAHKVSIAHKAEIPLSSFSKPNIFKLFLFDIGILGAMLDLDLNSLLDQNYGMIKGFFAENFVALELLSSGEKNLISWNENQAEVEFLLSGPKGIVPLEVKSGKLTKAKSLSSYISRYHPKLTIKASALNFNINDQNAVQNIPLYSVAYAPRKLMERHS